MKKICSCIILSVLVSGCTDELGSGVEPGKLVGDWYNQEEVILISNDELVLDLYALNSIPVKYSLDSDTIRFDSIFVMDAGGQIHESIAPYCFKVLSVGNDSLVLERISGASGSGEKIHLKRLTPREHLQMVQIDIRSSPCYGACPRFNVTIDSTGSVAFQFSDGALKGFELSDSEFEEWLDLIKSTEWSNLESEYWGEGSDSQFFEIKLKRMNRKPIEVIARIGEIRSIDVLVYKLYRKIAEIGKGDNNN